MIVHYIQGGHHSEIVDKEVITGERKLHCGQYLHTHGAVSIKNLL